MILGIDLSTSISGYSVINDDSELILNEAVDTRRDYNLYEAATENINKVKEIFGEYNIDEVYIEENLQTFRTGFSSAQTLSKLSKINGIVSWFIWNEYDVDFDLLNSRTARKEAGLTMNKEKKQKVKKQMLEEGKSESYADSKKTKMVVHKFIRGTEPNFHFKRTHADNPKPQSFDKADSIIIARAGENLNS